MENEKEIKKIRVLRTIGPILFFIDLIIGGIILFKNYHFLNHKILWIIEGILIGISIVMSIYRIAITKKEYKKQINIGMPIFGLILFLNGALIYSGILYLRISDDEFNESRMSEIQNDILRNSDEITVHIGNVCRKEHEINMDYIAELINEMEFTQIGYNVKECTDDNYYFMVEVSKHDYLLRLEFYHGTPWIEYDLMDGDIFPHMEGFYIKADSVKIEALYKYIIENHEEFHKTEEKKETC